MQIKVDLGTSGVISEGRDLNILGFLPHLKMETIES